MTATIIVAASLLLVSIIAVVTATLAQRRAIRAAEPHVLAVLEAGPGSTLDIVDRVKLRFATVDYRIVRGALDNLEQRETVVSWDDSTGNLTCRNGAPRRVYKLA